MNIKFGLGADPEVFLYSNIIKSYVPSIGLLGGTKEEPKRLSNCSIQEDNVTCEFNIIPSFTEKEWVNNCKAAITEVEFYVKPLGLELRFEPEVNFSQEQLNDIRAWVMGCDPDFNVYKFIGNSSADECMLPGMLINNYDPYMNTIRYSGGHIHISNEILAQDPWNHIAFIKVLDAIVGSYIALLSKAHNQLDGMMHRAQTYGKYGNFRVKPYGFEYRTPTNIWLLKPQYMEVIWNLVYTSLDVYFGNKEIPKYEQFLHDKDDLNRVAQYHEKQIQKMYA